MKREKPWRGIAVPETGKTGNLMLLIWPHFRTTDACLARLNRCESEGRNGYCGVRILSLEDKSSGESVLPRWVSGELRAAGGVRIGE